MGIIIRKKGNRKGEIKEERAKLAEIEKEQQHLMTVTEQEGMYTYDI